MWQLIKGFFSSAPAAEPQENMIELMVMGKRQQVPLSQLDLKEVNYKFEDVIIPVQIRTGKTGMIHHCFETHEKAQEFLDKIKKVDTSQLDLNERDGLLSKARVTYTGDDPTYKGHNFFRIRFTDAQFKFFIKKHGELDNQQSPPSLNRPG